MALSFQQRRRQLAVTGALGLAMVGVIVVLINLLGNWVFFRADLTARHSYSLSPASRKLVRDLSDPVIIKAYFTPDLPTPYNLYERYVRDLLVEYRSASRGRVRFEFALPNPPDQFERKAGEAGLIPIQFEQVGTDQFQMKRGYMGLVLFHRDKAETLPIIKDIAQIEYDLTIRIAKMASRSKKTVAVVTGHGEHPWQTSNTKMATDLADLYDLKTISLPLSSSAPVTADAFLVAGSKQKLDEASLAALDEMIMRGIPGAFFVDIKNIMIQQFVAGKQDSGLPALLKSYGILIGDRLIYDAQCQSIGVTQNIGGLPFNTAIRYPYIPLVDRIVATHPVGRGLDAVSLPFVAAVEAAQPLPNGVRFKPLLYTSQKSWMAPMSQEHASVAPNSIPQPAKDEPHGPYSVGAVFEGTFPSHVPGKTSAPTSIFVLGTAQVLNPNLPAFPGADALVSNALAFLTKDDTLAGIRSKGEIIRPLKPVSRPIREAIKYGTVLGTASLPILLGLWRWKKRELWRQKISYAFAAS